MRRYFMLIALLVMGGLALPSSWAQTAGTIQEFVPISPKQPDRNPELTYSVTFLSADAELSAAVGEGVRKRVKERGWSIVVEPDVAFYPDVVFVMDSDDSFLLAPQCRDAYVVQLRFPGQVRIDCNEVIRVKNAEEAVTKVLEFVERFYYSGQRPVYSTVFTAGEDGYSHFRIPSVLALDNGRILAFAEARGVSKTDCAENDLVLKYSDDEGRTWSPLVMVADGGESSYNNPTSVYVKEKGRILVLFQEYPPKLYEGSVQAGMEGEGITRCHIVYSDDAGLTWSRPREITRQVKLPEAAAYASGPGAAVRVVSGPDKGRILVPANVAGGDRGWFNYLFASDDAGESWFILPGNSAYGTNESQIVQTGETEFVVNARSHRFQGEDREEPEGWNPWRFGALTRCRTMIPVTIVGKSSTWHGTQMRYDLPDPICQGAIFRYSGLVKKEKSRLLFVNSANDLSVCVPENFTWTSPMRANGMVRLSYDEGQSWSHSRRIYGNRFTEFQYSVLTRTRSGKVACLFEAYPQIKLAVFDLEWLTGGQDKGKR